MGKEKEKEEKKSMHTWIKKKIIDVLTFRALRTKKKRILLFIGV